MHMKTHFSSISAYRNLSLSDFLKLASLMYIYFKINAGITYTKWYHICMYTSSNVNIFAKLHTKYVYIINIHTFTRYAQKNIQYILLQRLKLAWSMQTIFVPTRSNLIYIYMHIHAYAKCVTRKRTHTHLDPENKRYTQYTEPGHTKIKCMVIYM